MSVDGPLIARTCVASPLHATKGRQELWRVRASLVTTATGRGFKVDSATESRVASVGWLPGYAAARDGSAICGESA